MNTYDSRELLAEYCRGTEAAFTELVRAHIGLVHATALRLTGGDRHLAEDISQTVFSDLARMARTLSPNVQIGGWLHRHTCFVASKTMRSERRRQERERKAVEMNAGDINQSAGAEYFGPELDPAINELPEEDRAAIILRFFEQREYSEVGQRLGASEEAVRKRVSRAVEKLHAILTRRGLTISAAGLGAALAGGLAASNTEAMAAAVAASAISTTAGGGTTFAGAGALKLVSLGAALVLATGTPIYIGHRNETALRQANDALRSQVEKLEASQLQLANSQPAPNIAPAPVPATMETAEHRELLRLRGEVGVLRDKLNKATQPAAPKVAGIAEPVVTEPANITYSLPSIQVSQFIDIYAGLIGRNVRLSSDFWQHIRPSQTMWLHTVQPLTKSEATWWLETALREQASVGFRTNSDGTITAVPLPPPGRAARH